MMIELIGSRRAGAAAERGALIPSDRRAAQLIEEEARTLGEGG